MCLFWTSTSISLKHVLGLKEGKFIREKQCLCVFAFRFLRSWTWFMLLEWPSTPSSFYRENIATRRMITASEGFAMPWGRLAAVSSSAVVCPSSPQPLSSSAFPNFSTNLEFSCLFPCCFQLFIVSCFSGRFWVLLDPRNKWAPSRFFARRKRKESSSTADRW